MDQRIRKMLKEKLKSVSPSRRRLLLFLLLWGACLLFVGAVALLDLFIRFIATGVSSVMVAGIFLVGYISLAFWALAMKIDEEIDRDMREEDIG